jgi:hypothetical protein
MPRTIGPAEVCTISSLIEVWAESCGSNASAKPISTRTLAQRSGVVIMKQSPLGESSARAETDCSAGVPRAWVNVNGARTAKREAFP